MILLLFLVTGANAAPQLTWYEVYERGEKFFRKQEYQACIDDMDAALALQPVARKNQFTRAVQKIDYKPYYYKALAYYRLGGLPKAFESAQRAYAGEVVIDSPELQSDLEPILNDFSEQVQQLRRDFRLEENLVNEKLRLLALLADGELTQVETFLAETDNPEPFAEIQRELQRQREIRADQQRVLTELYDDIIDGIQKRLDSGDVAGARDLFENLKVNLPPASVALLQARFDSLPTVEVVEPEVVMVTEPDGGLTEDSARVLIPATEDEAAIYQARFETIELERQRMAKEVDQLTRRIVELRHQIQEERRNKTFLKPHLVLNLEAKGIRGIAVEGHAISPIAIRDLTLEVNGETYPLPASAISNAGAANVLSTVIKVRRFGRQQVTLSAVDDLDGGTQTFKVIDIARPWYLNRAYWFGALFILLATITTHYYLSAVERKRARLLHFNPYVAGSPVRDFDLFFGRDKLLYRIQGLVHKNSFMIHGNRRIGKTSLLLQLKTNLSTLKSADYRFYPVFIDLQGVAEDDLFHYMMSEVLTQATEWNVATEDLVFREDTPQYSSRPFSKDIKKIITRLDALGPEHAQVVLLMDEVDVLNEFGEKTNQKLRGIFMKDFADHLSCVMAGIHLKKEWESSGSPWYNFFEEIPVNVIDEKAARALILEPVKGIFKFKPQAIDLIVNETGGHPYLIQKVCVSLIGEKLSSNRFNITRSDVEQALGKLHEEIKRNQHELYH